MTTGERIKQARKNAGLTQTELAEKVGVKYSAIHKYESGIIVNLKRETIDAIAKALDVKPSWLLCIDEEKKPAASNELYSGLVNMSDKELDALFMKLVQNRDKDFLLRLASQILEIASNKGS